LTYPKFHSFRFVPSECEARPKNYSKTRSIFRIVSFFIAFEDNLDVHG